MTEILNRALSKSEASAAAGVCEKTLDRYIADGRIRAHRIGGRVKVFERDMKDFLDGCATGAPAPGKSASISEGSETLVGAR
jgi:excisionase family DNA binding protein